MEMPNSMYYSYKATSHHPIAREYRDCLEKISEISKNEGAGKTPFTDEVAINLDKVETERAKKKKSNVNSTMDMAFCTSQNKLHKMILVEYKLRVKKPENIDKKEIDKKITYSKTLLSQSVNIYNKFYFIFKTAYKNQAIYRLRRLYSNKNNHKAIDMNELKEIFFNKND